MDENTSATTYFPTISQTKICPEITSIFGWGTIELVSKSEVMG